MAEAPSGANARGRPFGSIVTGMRRRIDPAIVWAFGCIVLVLLIGSLYSTSFLSPEYLLQQLKVASFLGVIATGAAKAQLVGNGFNSKPVALNSTGFASFRIPSPPGDPNGDGAGALGVIAQVQLLDASGHPLAGLSVPPSLGG